MRFGTLAPTYKAQDSGTDMSVLTMQDRAMLVRYMTLSLADRKLDLNLPESLFIYKI